jgi:hypothetical protein
MPTFSVLAILLFLVSSIAAFDIEFTRAKKNGTIPPDDPNEPDLPKWVMAVYFVAPILALGILFIDWKRALFVFFVIFTLSGFIPVLDTIGNVLMRPFKPRKRR